MNEKLESAVAAHYQREDLAGAILAGLREQGVDPDHPRIEDLAAVDEFHTGGRAATLKAFELFEVPQGGHILDIGCGIGGAARALALERDCTVTGIDLTPAYVEVARMLTQRTGLEERCRFEVASALDLPFEDATFDAAFSFHVAMNIEDRGRFLGEAARVLRADAPLCLFDVMKGPTEGMRYPVPWAERAETSVLKTRDETLTLLDDAGFIVAEEENLRDFALDFFETMFAKAAERGGPPPLGLHLLTGANGREKFTNYRQALADHQVEPVILVAHTR
jgi:MPBQ/MSBQ methyltransferase